VEVPCEGGRGRRRGFEGGRGGARVRPGGREVGARVPDPRGGARADRSRARTHAFLASTSSAQASHTPGETCVYPASGSSKANGPLPGSAPAVARARMASSLSEPAGVEASSAVEARTVPRVTTREARPRRDAPAGGECESGFAARENMVEVAIATPRVEVRRCPRNRREGASEQGRITEVPNGRPASATSAATTEDL